MLRSIEQRFMRSRYSLQPTAYSLQPTAYSLQPTAYSLQPTAYSLQPTAYSLQPLFSSHRFSPLLMRAFQLISLTLSMNGSGGIN